MRLMGGAAMRHGALRPPAALGRRLCPPRPSPADRCPARSAHTPRRASGDQEPWLFSRGLSRLERTDGDSKQPACGSSGLNISRPSASLCLTPRAWALTLKAGPGALSFILLSCFPLYLLSSRSLHYSLLWSTAKTCLVVTHPASAGTLSLMGCLPGMFQRRACPDRAVAARLGEDRRGDVEHGVMGVGVRTGEVTWSTV